MYFDFSLGLSAPLDVYEGHFESLANDIAKVEQTLGLVRQDRSDNVAQWETNKFENISDDVLCDTAKQHNRWVRELYHYWASKPTGPEVLTPEIAQQIWHALTFIRVPPRRWTADYYRDNMERVFDVMVTGDRDGIPFNVEKLTVKQAAQVVVLFSEFLDTEDIRLTVPVGYDFLVSGEDCVWCSVKGVDIHGDDSCPDVAGCKDKECAVVADRDYWAEHGE